jgi:nucleoside-diphosphate-sugar epimerase
MTRVLIIGGAGFVGARLAAACLAAGETVAVLARAGTDTDRLAAIKGQIELARGDAACVNSLDAAIRSLRPDVIYHLAARTRPDDQAVRKPWQSVEDGLAPVLRLVEAAMSANHVPRAIIRAGTIAEYPQSAAPVQETTREGPRDPYGAAAAAATHYLEMLSPHLPFPAVTARLALLYGPGQSQSFFIPWAIAQGLARQPIRAARPEDRRDLLYVDDAVEALRLIAEKAEVSPTTLNISTGRAPRMGTVAEMIQHLCGADGPVAATPHLINTAPPSALCADSTLAAEAIGWRPRTELDDGLKRTVEWERQKRSLANSQIPLTSASRC